MENNENNIGKNTSSGVKKVEKIARNNGQNTTKTTVKTTEYTPENTNFMVENEQKNAEIRVKNALLKQERKAKRDEMKALHKQKQLEAKNARKARLIELQAEREKRFAEWRKQREAYKAERKTRKDERKNNRTQGVGGWIAAVVTLGVATLTLGAVVTVGTTDIREMRSTIGTGYRSGLYELTGIVDEVDNDLDKLRASNDPEMQSEILTEILVQTRLAEGTLEKMPVPYEKEENVTTFINDTAKNAEKLLGKLRRGERLTEEDKAEIEREYEKNHEIRAVFDELAMNTDEKDITKWMKDKANGITDKLNGVENMLRKDIEEILPTATKQSREEGITSTKAEELLRTYFEKFDLKEVEFAGETTAELSTFNFNMVGQDGRNYFAEISSKSGELVSFNSFEECEEKILTVDNARQVAEKFLTELGYEDMALTWTNENDTQASFTYCFEDDGFVYYPDAVLVKVCEGKGVIAGFDATKFLQNHKDRKAPKIALTEEQARQKLLPTLDVEDVQKVVIQIDGKDVETYEFTCKTDENEYRVYIDAVTGREVKILKVENSKQGRRLK